MAKEYTQALDDLFGLVAFQGSFERAQKYFNIIEEALNRLEAIDNDNPSEALECLERIETVFSLNKKGKPSVYNDYLDSVDPYYKDYNTIKQALIKAQEQEKDKIFLKNLHNTNVKVPLVSIFNGLTQEKKFAYTEHIYYNWEELKEYLEAKIETIKTEKEKLELKLLKQEKALKIIFEKRIDMWHLVDLLDQDYEMYIAFCKSEKYEEDYILTEEEFNLLKKVSK